MGLKSEAQDNPRAAIFSRNHRAYLEAAVEVGEADPARHIALRSKQRWANAQRAVDAQGPRRIYFAVIGEENQIQYSACLDEVIVDPDPENAEHKEKLDGQLAGTRGEGFWDGDVRTLYLISNCRPEKPFPVTELNRLEGGEPVDEDYGYGYALVRARSRGSVEGMARAARRAVRGVVLPLPHEVTHESRHHLYSRIEREPQRRPVGAGRGDLAQHRPPGHLGA